MKLDYKKTFILGFGFFAISLVWPLYNYFVPLYLKEYISSQFWINAVMTLDNLLAVSLIPYFGTLSDNTHTKYGRRMPYLLIGIPISAILFGALPMYSSFWSLAIIIFLLNMSMVIYRAPTVALMPDITPGPLRSEANGIINFMGGLASVFALLVAATILYKINPYLPFISTSILMILAAIVLFVFIKEPEKGVSSKEDKISIIASMVELVNNKDKTALYILMAIFFWFFGYQGVETTFSNYSVYYLGIEKTMGSAIIGTFALVFLLFAIPSGFLAAKIGKKKTILIGITGLVTVFSLLGMIRTTTRFLSLPFNAIMMMLLGIGGFFWAFININSYPMVIETTTEEKIGTYTGLYYFFSSLAAIMGPLVFGFFIDIIGYEIMFFASAISFVIAFVFILKVKVKSN